MIYILHILTGVHFLQGIIKKKNFEVKHKYGIFDQPSTRGSGAENKWLTFKYSTSTKQTRNQLYHISDLHLWKMCPNDLLPITKYFITFFTSLAKNQTVMLKNDGSKCQIKPHPLTYA